MNERPTEAVWFEWGFRFIVILLGVALTYIGTDHIRAVTRQERLRDTVATLQANQSNLITQMDQVVPSADYRKYIETKFLQIESTLNRIDEKLESLDKKIDDIVSLPSSVSLRETSAIEAKKK